MNDRAGDLECQEIQEALTAKVLDGWDPEWVAEKMVEKRRDLEIIRGWAKETEALRGKRRACYSHPDALRI